MNQRQEIFNKVADHLLTQNAKSMYTNDDKDFVCAYRGEGGLKCAVGVLITDDHYYPRLEGLGCCAVSVNKALCDSLGFHFDKDNGPIPRMLSELQWIHDEREPSEWLELLTKATEDLELDPSPVMLSRAS